MEYGKYQYQYIFSEVLKFIYWSKINSSIGLKVLLMDHIQPIYLSSSILSPLPPPSDWGWEVHRT